MKNLPEIIISKEVMPTKANIEPVAQSIFELVESGQMSAGELAVKIKFIGDVFDLLRGKIIEQVRDEAFKHEREGGLKLYGATIKSIDAGIKYDYSTDVIWNRIKDKITPLETERKLREKRLQFIDKKIIEVDEETGETIEVNPIVRNATPSFKIELGK